MKQEWNDDGWRIPDTLWEKIEPLLPVPVETHPWGVHRPRVPNRTAMDGIFFIYAPAANGKRSMPRVFVPGAPPIAASRNGKRLGCSRSSGSKGWKNTTRYRG